MPDLTAFLLARIDEDEAVARAVGDLDDVGGYEVEPFDEAPILTIGPGRVVAECEAKRRIVELHPRVDTSIWGAEAVEVEQATCGRCRRYGEPLNGWPCGTLRLLALPYADHPDYREEWKAVEPPVPHPCLGCGHALYRHAQDGRSCADCETCEGYSEEWKP